MKVIENLLQEKSFQHSAKAKQKRHTFSGGIALPGSKIELASDGSGTQQRHNGIHVTPTAGFVVKSRAGAEKDKDRKIFVNVCSSDALVSPHKAHKLNDEGNEVEGTTVPVAVGPLRICHDRAGQPSFVVDCVVHPTVIENCETDTTGGYRDFVSQLVIQYVETKYKDEVVPIDKKYRTPRMKYHGYVDRTTGLSADKSHKHAAIAKQWVRDGRAEPRIEQVDTPSKPLLAIPNLSDGAKAKDFLLDVTIETSDFKIYPVLEFLKSEMCLGWQDHQRVFSMKDLDFAPMLAAALDETSLGLYTSCDLPHPLLVDAPDHAQRFRIHVKIPDSLLHTVDIRVSAFLVTVEAAGFKKAKCVLPFYSQSKSAKSTYDLDSQLLKIWVNVSNEPMELGPDPGTNQWNVRHGINKYPAKGAAQAEEKPSGLGQIDGDDVESDGMAEDVALPEDCFHAKDVTSQYMLDLQKKERDEKREKASKIQDTFENDPNTIVLPANSSCGSPIKEVQWSEGLAEPSCVDVGKFSSPFRVVEESIGKTVSIMPLACRFLLD
jgi:hypothetical protein